MRSSLLVGALTHCSNRVQYLSSGSKNTGCDDLKKELWTFNDSRSFSPQACLASPRLAANNHTFVGLCSFYPSDQSAPLATCSTSTPLSTTTAPLCLSVSRSTAKMVQISEVKNQGRDNRTSAHTHIKGLGLSLSGTADKQSAGFVGQQTAREVSRARGAPIPSHCALGSLRVASQTS